MHGTKWLDLCKALNVDHKGGEANKAFSIICNINLNNKQRVQFSQYNICNLWTNSMPIFGVLLQSCFSCEYTVHMHSSLFHLIFYYSLLPFTIILCCEPNNVCVIRNCHGNAQIDFTHQRVCMVACLQPNVRLMNLLWHDLDSP